MIEVAIMIEGQMGLNWDRWRRMAKAVEDLGFIGLYRSDHYTNSNPPDYDSLELWVSLSWLASHTKRIEFGPLVTPLSFRDPALTARMASAVDDLSSGRLTLGLGAGWQEREHESWGWELLDIPNRFQRFEEGLEIISQLFNSDQPITVTGDYYHVDQAMLLPRPHRKGGPPISIGGSGPKRTLPLIVKYAKEWNSLPRPVEKFEQLSTQLDQMLVAAGRKPNDVKRSMMVTNEYGRDDNELKARIEERGSGDITLQEFIERGMVAGSGNQIVEQLGRLAEAGLQRVMLQWLDLDGIDRLEAMATEILPQVNN